MTDQIYNKLLNLLSPPFSANVLYLYRWYKIKIKGVCICRKCDYKVSLLAY